MNRINLLGCLCDSLPHFNELHLSVSMYMSSTATCAHVKPLVYLALFIFLYIHF